MYAEYAYGEYAGYAEYATGAVYAAATGAVYAAATGYSTTRGLAAAKARRAANSTWKQTNNNIRNVYLNKFNAWKTDLKKNSSIHNLRKQHFSLEHKTTKKL